MTPEQWRQFGRELRERRGEAEDLRRELERAGLGGRDLEQVIERMRRLEAGPGGFATKEEFDVLRASVVESLKAFEFALRRQVEGAEKERVLLGGSGEVPEGFRKLVEEYYKSLADRQQKPPK